MVMSEEGTEEMEPFTMISKDEASSAGLLGTFRSGKTWIQVPTRHREGAEGGRGGRPGFTYPHAIGRLGGRERGKTWIQVPTEPGALHQGGREGGWEGGREGEGADLDSGTHSTYIRRDLCVLSPS